MKILRKEKRMANVDLKKPIDLRDYQQVKVLGEGSFGKVAIWKLNPQKSTLVVKTMRKAKTGQVGGTTPADFENEKKVLAHLHDRCQMYILCYSGYAEDADNYYIMTELLDNYITLADFIKLHRKQAVASDVLKISTNLVKGLQEIHSLNVAHRDIKPANIMVNMKTGNIKYIDFGLACRGQACDAGYQIGTPYYWAPEIQIQQPSYTLELLKKTDIFSLGLTIFELLQGKHVYDIIGERLTERDIKKWESAHPGQRLSPIEIQKRKDAYVDEIIRKPRAIDLSMYLDPRYEVSVKKYLDAMTRFEWRRRILPE